jgi:P-type E1-E2 ATPase
LRIGDTVLVRPGARVPPDGAVVEGAADVDEFMITGESKTVPKAAGAKVLQRAASTYATRLSAGRVTDEWVIQLLRQANSDVFKKYSQMKLETKRDALAQLNRRANEMTVDEAQTLPVYRGIGTVSVQ